MAIRRLPLVLALAAVAACGGDGGGGAAGLDETFSYFPAETSVLAVVSTDLESEQFRELDELVRRRFGRPLEEFLRLAVESEGRLSWDEDVRPLLGKELVLGVVNAAAVVEDEPVVVVVAFRASDGERLRATIENVPDVRPAGEHRGAALFLTDGAALAVDGDVLVAAEKESSLRQALDRAAGADHLAPETFADAQADLPQDALLRLYADVRRGLELEAAAPFRSLPWVAALRTAGLAASFRDGAAELDFALNTDADELEKDDLPLATGSEAPGVLERGDEIAGGNRKQSLTTAFLFRAAELAFPDSRFVRDVHALEQELGIDFVDEVLRQFDGPSASAVSPDGQTFAARSEITDPEGFERLLPRLAPHLPRLVAGLEALQSEGQALLFLFAPDVLVLQSQQVEVDRIGDLWRVSGLTGEGPDQLYFGILGDVFVVASTPELARSVATEETVEVEGARGAGVLRVDLSGAAGEVRRRFGFDLGPAGELVAWLEASEERLRGRIRVRLR